MGFLIKDTKHHRFLLLKKEVFTAFMIRALERTGQLYAEFCTRCCWSHCSKKVSQETDSKTEVEWEVSWRYRSTAGAWGAGWGRAWSCHATRKALFAPSLQVPPPIQALLSFFFFLAASCGMWDLVPRPGIEPIPPSLGAWSLNHWTAKEVPPSTCLSCNVTDFKNRGCDFSEFYS